MKKFTKIFTSILILTSLNVNAKDIYKFEDFNSEYLNEYFEFKRPFAYISGLEYCNLADKNIALNTSCLMDYNSQYELSSLMNNCNNCVDKNRLTKPRNLIYKDSIKGTIIKSFKVERSSMLERAFSSPINMLILKDNEGNLIEMSEIFFTLNKDSELFYDEEIKLQNKYKTFQKSQFLVETFCLFDQINPEKNKYDIANEIIKDFNLTGLIVEDYNHCPTKSKKGLNIIVKDFNSFLTFQYYMKEWGLFGYWR